MKGSIRVLSVYAVARCGFSGRTALNANVVVPGLVPGTHADMHLRLSQEAVVSPSHVDARDKRGHDDFWLLRSGNLHRQLMTLPQRELMSPIIRNGVWAIAQYFPTPSPPLRRRLPLRLADGVKEGAFQVEGTKALYQLRRFAQIDQAAAMHDGDAVTDFLDVGEDVR